MYIMKTFIIYLLFMLTYGTLSAQNYVTLTGNVFDAGNNRPLQDCEIYLSGFNYGTFTDSLGHFELRIPVSVSNQYLIASFVGYRKYSIQVKDITGSSEEIPMAPETKLLDELIIKENPGITVSGLPWDYREIDLDYAAIESPEVILSDYQ